jgi:hypothetical protein
MVCGRRPPPIRFVFTVGENRTGLQVVPLWPHQGAEWRSDEMGHCRRHGAHGTTGVAADQGIRETVKIIAGPDGLGTDTIHIL